ncbi:MAG: fused MFS/spermidine synthase [Gammaproteobacteria bacterium]|nr:fused MFS/spermidine synthase [Gammaproteobacteria bacterium]
MSLAVLFSTGLVAIASEVGWTKYLAIFTGTTIYGFAAILTVFLIGIASGSWWIKSRLDGLRTPHLWLSAGLVVLGLALLLTREGLSFVPNIYSGVNYLDASAPVIYAVKYLVVFLMLIVPTFLFGALFPLNLKLYCVDLRGVRTRVGRAYAVNTLASIIGAILAGFYLIPEYGTDVLLTCGALLILALPLLFLPIPGPGRVGAIATAGAAIAVVGLNWLVPHIDYKTMISSVAYKYDEDVKAGRKPEFIFLKEGKAGVISAVSYDGKLAKLQNNGLNESMIDMKDATHARLVEQLLSLIPYFLHEKPRSAFIVGFGGGVTTRALTYTDLESIRVVELEPAIVDAGRAIVKGEIPALQDPRVHLEFNDARNTLLLDSTRYDIVAAQASHPWLAGAANVFTKEFFELVRTRLNSGGIYGQWVNLFNMDATTLRAIFKAFFTVFPEGVTFSNMYTGDFMLFGSDRPLTFDYPRIAARMDNPQIKAALAHYMIQTPDDLISYFALSRREALAATTADGPLNSDTNILSEVRLARLIDVPKGAENPYDFINSNFKFDITPYLKPEQAAQQIFDTGSVFLRWDDTVSTRHAARQLESLSESLSRTLNYELLRYEGKFDEAFKLYAAHAQWPDSIHRKQIESLSELARFPEARKLLERMADDKQRRSAAAYLLYQQGQWTTLEAVRPVADEERKWQLLAAARHDIKSVGPQLVSMQTDGAEDIPLARTLLNYYAARNDQVNMQAQARRLLAAIDARVQRLATTASSALLDKDTVRASQILTIIENLDPKSKQLEDLRTRLAEVKAAVALVPVPPAVN